MEAAGGSRARSTGGGCPGPLRREPFRGVQATWGGGTALSSRPTHHIGATGKPLSDYECADATFGGSANINSGLPSWVMVDSSTITRDKLVRDGRSYIPSSNVCSRIER